MTASVQDEISRQMKVAIKNGQKDRLDVLRMLLSELAVAAASGSEYGELDVIRSYARRLKNDAAEYERLALDDRTRQAQSELAVVEEFLPRQLDRPQLEQIIERMVAENDLGPRDIGRSMKIVMSEYGDRVDGRMAQEIVRERLQPPE